jgi:hypothetical protein
MNIPYRCQKLLILDKIMKKAEHKCWDIEIEILTTISKEIQKILKKTESLLHSHVC